MTLLEVECRKQVRKEWREGQALLHLELELRTLTWLIKLLIFHFISKNLYPMTEILLLEILSHPKKQNDHICYDWRLTWVI